MAHSVGLVLSSSALLAAASGFGLGLSLIVAIGAQNAFVLRQGLRGEHVMAVVAVCTVSDVVLIATGVQGAGAVLTQLPWLVTSVRLGGAAFLLAYGALAARRALRPGALNPEVADPASGLTAVVGVCLALTWLNPHVYLDTVILLGSIANTYEAERWWFAMGAATGSAVWFVALGYGARWLRPVFTSPTAWRVLDAAIAVVMATLAVLLVTGAE